MDEIKNFATAESLGKKIQIKTLLLFPVFLLGIAVIFLLILTNFNNIFYMILIALYIIYNLMIYSALKNIARTMLLIYFLFLSASLLMISSCLYLIIVHVPLSSSHIAMINVKYPWGLIISASLICIYVIYFFKKYLEIDVHYVRSFLKKEKNII